MDLSEMAQPSRRINFVGSGNEGDRLRGMDYFKAQEEMFPDLAWTGTTLALERDRCGLYIVLQPGNPGVADALEHVASLSCGCHSIVDVHADFWSATPNPNLPDATPPEMWTWWHEGGHVAALERAMRAADVVTVPSVEYVSPVERFNPNVVIVPDASDNQDDTENAVAVARVWLEAIQIAARHKRT